MSGDVVTWAAMVAAIGALISIITFWTRYSDRITKADAAAAAALKEAEAAVAEAKKAASLEAKLYQVEIWARDEFVRKASFESAVLRMEKGFGDLKVDIASRLDRITDRIDHLGHLERKQT